MQDKLSKHITGFWISYGTKDSLITMPEKWKGTLAKWENICFIYGFPQRLWHKNRDLLLAKLRAYRFSIWNYNTQKMLHYKELKYSLERVPYIKLFINKFNWEGIKYPSRLDDWKRFE